MNVEVLDTADADLILGAYFYESQETGLGIEFRESILADLAGLQLTGGIHSRKFGYHHCNGARFPYTIYYRVEHDTVFVIAILDSRMNPDTIRDRLHP
jgi:plasmid stabilization system protein ParE